MNDVASIKILAGDMVLAEHAVDNPLSSYGVPVWTIRVPDPLPGPATIRVGPIPCPVEIVSLRNSWLIIRISFGYLAGIAWRDGEYFSDLLVDDKGLVTKTYSPGLSVRGRMERVT